MDTIINYDDVNITPEIKNLIELFAHIAIRIVEIVAIGVSPIDAMHHRLACGIGFKAEGSIPIAMHLHLLCIEGLNPANHRFHRMDHFGAVWTVVGQEVDEPHGARYADVQICQPLGRRTRRPPLLLWRGCGSTARWNRLAFARDACLSWAST